jgi:hypothetical protein
MTTFGIKVSKPGYDVKTCTEENLVMSSELRALKVAHTDSPESFGEYEHNLNYAPAFIVAGLWDTTHRYFVGQEYSEFEMTYYCTSTVFSYWGTCTYFLFYLETL